jgi:hypothetical protein
VEETASFDEPAKIALTRGSIVQKWIGHDWLPNRGFPFYWGDAGKSRPPVDSAPHALRRSLRNVRQSRAAAAVSSRRTAVMTPSAGYTRGPNSAQARHKDSQGQTSRNGKMGRELRTSRQLVSPDLSSGLRPFQVKFSTPRGQYWPAEPVLPMRS